MRAKVTESGVTIPPEWFPGVTEVEIRRQDGTVLIAPVRPEDPIKSLGKQPVPGDVTDASVELDKYIYGGE